MDNSLKIQELIEKTIIEIIEKCSDNKKLKELIEKHSKKIHFIPKKYRVLGGILQSMNIQFGNFIEVLMKNLISNEDDYEILEDYNANRKNEFLILEESDQLIDNYITKCQLAENMDLEEEFEQLKKELFFNIYNKKRVINHFLTIKHDIDLLFKNKNTNKIYYIEIKYNDDHDTGKFVDINRKVIKTYSYLLNSINVNDYNDIIPILFFFNNKKKKENIYIPEKTNIMRGKTFFDEFLSADYNEVESYLLNLSENSQTIELFDSLYQKIMDII